MNPVPDRAWKLLEPEGAWTQGASARDSAHRVLPYWDKRACQWCTLGAIGVAYPPLRLLDVEQRLRRELPQGTAEWNDDPTRTQAEVVALLKSLDI